MAFLVREPRRLDATDEGLAASFGVPVLMSDVSEGFQRRDPFSLNPECDRASQCRISPARIGAFDVLRCLGPPAISVRPGGEALGDTGRFGPGDGVVAINRPLAGLQCFLLERLRVVPILARLTQIVGDPEQRRWREVNLFEALRDYFPRLKGSFGHLF